MHRAKLRLKEIEPSLVAHLDFDLAVPLLEEGNVLTVDEAAHVLRRARALSKEHAVHELVRILAASPFRSLRCALERCAGTHGHRELLKELDRLVTADMESGMSETEPKTEGHQQSGDDLGQSSIHDISWKQLSPMLVGMQNAHARVLGNKIYVGGGATGMIDLSCKVYVYDYVYDKWDVLSLSPVYNFALEVYDNCIFLIGGREADSGVVTGEVWSWSQTDQMWKESPLQPMPTPRHSASSAAYGQYIVVAGGFAVTAPVSTVEVYSGTSEQWIPAQSLPQPQSHMKQVVANGTWILMGGSGSKGGTQMVFSTSLEALISDAEETLHLSDVPQQCKEEGSTIWRLLPHVPHMDSSIAYLGNVVVVLGKDGSTTAPIFALDSHLQNWVFVSELPFSCQNSVAVSIPGGALFIFGGIAYDASEKSLSSISNLVHLITLPRAEFRSKATLFDGVHSTSNSRRTIYYDCK